MVDQKDAVGAEFGNGPRHDEIPELVDKDQTVLQVGGGTMRQEAVSSSSSSSRRGVIVMLTTRCCLLQIPTIVVPMATTNEGHRLYDTYIRERDDGERERC